MFCYTHSYLCVTQCENCVIVFSVSLIQAVKILHFMYHCLCIFLIFIIKLSRCSRILIIKSYTAVNDYVRCRNNGPVI